ncbi:hypothetical protein IAU60_002680 [Kwoniella sp. DSM 27419]
MRFAPSTLVSALLLASSSAIAQRFTTTYPWAQGDTVVLSTGTDARGLPTTTILSTVVTGATGAITTVPTTRATTTTRNAAVPAGDDDDTTTSTTSPTTTARGGRTTTTDNQRVVGGISTDSYEPMRTTTYWLDPGDGVWVPFTWTAPTTALPTVPTANVPAGTVADYNSYQSNVNSVVLESAENAVASQSRAANSAGTLIASGGAMGGWTALVVGAVGAGVGLLAL